MATEAAVPTPLPVPVPVPDEKPVPGIAGLAALKGIVLYGATLTFAGLYVYFIVKISAAHGGPPVFDAALVSTAAALAGVLGSAFALEVGTTTDAGGTNRKVGEALTTADTTAKMAVARVRQLFSLEPTSTSSPSWPKTFGIWVYAAVAAGVSITYVLNQNQTPDTIKALAVAFGGYVIALVTAAYKSAG